jgi:hypothetical protein
MKATLIRIPEIRTSLFEKKSMKAVTKPRRIFNQAANKVLVKDYKNKMKKHFVQKTRKIFYLH